MTLLEYAISASVVALLAAIAVVDARRLVIEPLLILGLVVAAAAWHMVGFGTRHAGNAWDLAIGAALGVAVVAVPIAIAQWTGRKRPIGPGDALLLGATGFLLGVGSLGWALIAGCACAVGHRICNRWRRGRPIWKGYFPLGPGLCAGAIAAFLALHAGQAGAQEASAEPAARLPAVEIAPPAPALPADIAGKRVSLSFPEPAPLEAVVARIEAAGGIRIRVEERPSRVADGDLALAPAPALPWTFEGSLQDLVWLIQTRTGYAWDWDANQDELVLYRYWDREWALPEGAKPPPPAPRPGPFAWIGRLFGGGSEAPKASSDAQPAGEEGAGPGQAAADEAPDPAAPAGETPAEGEAPPSATARDAEGAPAEPDRDAVPAPESWQAAAGETLQETLEKWGREAGWTVVWQPTRTYTLSAGAAFEGDFLAAVDQVLADPATRRTLTATAYAANRHLVVQDVDTPR